MSSTITATEAARRFSDLLNRVRYRGESFLITRGGEEVAKLAAASTRPTVSLRELVIRLREERTGNPGFAEELERIQAEQPTLSASPWDS